MGVMYELDAIAAAVIGGTSLTGGVGRITGTVIGTIILGVMISGFTFLRRRRLLPGNRQGRDHRRRRRRRPVPAAPTQEGLREVPPRRGRAPRAQGPASPDTGDNHEDRARSLHASPPAAARAAAAGRRARLRVYRAVARAPTSSTGGCGRASIPERIKEFRRALATHGVKLASLLPMYRWASPNEAERQAAVQELEARDPGRGRDGLRHHELRVRPRAVARTCRALHLLRRRHHRGLRGGLVALDGGAGADPRARGHQPPHRAAPRGLRRDAAAGRRHDPDDQLQDRAGSSTARPTPSISATTWPR